MEHKWLLDNIGAIKTLKSPKTINTYFGVLRKGLGDDGKLDPVKMEATMRADTQPVRVQRMLKTLLTNYPELATPELEELLALPLVNGNALGAKRLLPSVEEVEEWNEYANELLSRPPVKTKRDKAKDHKRRVYSLLVWTITELALSGLPLRNSELISIRINDPESPNNLDIEKEVLTLAKSKTDAVRVLDMVDFGKAWAERAIAVYGKLPPSLIVSLRGTPMSRNAFEKTLPKLNPELGSQTMRKVFATESILEGDDVADAELASRMGHSKGVHGTTYFAPQ